MKFTLTNSKEIIEICKTTDLVCLRCVSVIIFGTFYLKLYDVL